VEVFIPLKSQLKLFAIGLHGFNNFGTGRHRICST